MSTATGWLLKKVPFDTDMTIIFVEGVFHTGIIDSSNLHDRLHAYERISFLLSHFIKFLTVPKIEVLHDLAFRTLNKGLNWNKLHNFQRTEIILAIIPILQIIDQSVVLNQFSELFSDVCLIQANSSNGLLHVHIGSHHEVHGELGSWPW